MKFTGERFIPGQCDLELQIEHFNRYQFARQFVTGKRVLDAACGVGYGSAFLAQDADFVAGIDISEESIAYAKEKYSGIHTEFQIGSIAKLPYDDGSFDVVVSFETLEHVDANVQKDFMREIRRVLAEDGVLIMSTPNHSIYSKRGVNQFHVKELEYVEFQDMLEEAFEFVQMFSQQFEICNIIGDSKSDSAWMEGQIPGNEAEYLIAVCSNCVFDNIVSRVFVRDDKKLAGLMDWAQTNHIMNEKNNALIAEMNVELEAQRYELSKKEGYILAKNGELAAKNEELEAKNEELEAKNGELIAKNSEIAILRQEIANKQGHIELLLEPERELNRIKASRSWRFMSCAWKIRDIIVPKGSYRRLFGKAAIKFVKHPIHFLSKLTPKRIGKFFKFMRTEGAEGVGKRLDNCLLPHEVYHQEFQIDEMAQRVNVTFDDYEKIRVPQWEKPLVSIVIPVYNQFNYTYNCIKSIVRNSGSIEYEILVADDCSTDLTTRIQEIIDGLILVVNPKNLRFLHNCNNASKIAKGKYILFLNNDTQVQENWLEPLVELIQQDKSIGLVGSKLVYPDGRLQEAGGIFWKDGSAWNYGNQSDPALPEYNYVKEVDYISGASIMISRALWQEIGGFDDRFAPAYYEDCDLAFAVRQRGYRVMYQPLSTVVHFEGVSNGRDITSGQKSYQVVNQAKFYEKWKDILERDHFDNGMSVFAARDRSRYKKTVVVVDHYIPTFDKDTGSRTVYQYLKLLVEMGYNVKLIPDNFHHDTTYSTVYEQMGIEVLYGPYYANNWKRWLKENSRHIQYMLLCRPHISIKYIDFVRANMDAKIIYFGVDLQYLREKREYEVTGDVALKHSAERWEKTEYEIMEKSDVSLTLSTYEKEIMDPRIGENKVYISPVFFYTNDDIKRQATAVKGRQGILFVGGFNHHPNADGVLWFVKEVLWKIRESIPDCTFYIVGSNPTASVQAIADAHTIVTGFVSDEELEQYYARARVVVIPLRYGAGVKGKTIEAMYHGVPVVSTSTGTEGLTDIEHYIPSVDESEKFAQRVIELYQRTDEQLEEIHAQYTEYIKRYYSYDSAKVLFEKLFD